MDKDIRNRQLHRVLELQDKIANWGVTNSQSNPGAVMELRRMKKELETLKKGLGL